MLKVISTLKELTTQSNDEDNDEEEDDEDSVLDDAFIDKILADIEMDDDDVQKLSPEGRINGNETNNNNTGIISKWFDSLISNKNIDDSNNIKTITKKTTKNIQKLESIHNQKHHRQSTAPITATPPLPPLSHQKRHYSTNHLLLKQKIWQSNNIELDKNMAIKKVIRCLHEVDEDKNGYLDYQEFEEALKNIDHNLLPSQIEEIYQEIVWNPEDELSIKLFSQHLYERCKDLNPKSIKNHKKIKKIAPVHIIQWTFSDKLHQYVSDTSISSINASDSALNKIYDILREKDDDNDMFVDWNEFEEACMDLGLLGIQSNALKNIFDQIVNNQQKNTQELNIKQFVSKLSKVYGSNSMQPHQILFMFMSPMIPHKLKQKKQSSRRYTIDLFEKSKAKHCGANDFLATLQTNSKTLNEMELSQFYNHKQSKHSHRRYQTFSSLPSMKQTNSSILSKLNCSVIVISALQRQLNEVDEDKNGLIDFEEFIDAIHTLKTAMHTDKASKLFNALSDKKSNELNINAFMKRIKMIYAQFPNISGDECLSRMYQSHTQNISRTHSSMSSMSSIIYTMDDEKKATMNDRVIEQIKEMILHIDEDENGMIDKQEFIALLSEWNVDQKFNENELDLMKRKHRVIYFCKK